LRKTASGLSTRAPLAIANVRMPPRLRTLSNNVISTYNAEDIIVGHAIPSAELKALSLAIRSEVAREREMSDGRSSLKLLPPIGPSVRPSVRPTDGARSSIAVRRVTVTITVITIIAERSRKYQLFDEQHSRATSRRCNANAARGHEREHSCRQMAGALAIDGTPQRAVARRNSCFVARCFQVG